MSASVTLNGTPYTIPQTGDDSWSVGNAVDAYLIALASGVLQKAGGAFTLTSEVDFGATYGLKSPYFKSITAFPSLAGALRLAKTDTVSFRNNANSSDLVVGIDVSDNLTYNSTKITLSGAIVNADINAAAAIAYSKLALTGSVTNSDIASAAAISYSKLSLTASVVNADISASAAITYSKLALTSSIVNADISASAAITYSKLVLTGSVTNSDIATAAAISYSKLSLTSSVVNADISASAAISYSKLALTSSIVNADVSASAAISYSKLSLASSIVNADVATGAAISYSKLNLATSIVNSDIATSAAIAMSKLAALGTSRAVITDGSGVLTTTGTTATNLTNFGSLTDGTAGQILSTLGSNTGYAWASALSSTLNQYNTFIGNSSNVVTATNTNQLGDVLAKTGSQTFTVTIASPGVFTATAHGLAVGDQIYLTTTGALPTGLSANTKYYVNTVTANTFQLSTSYGNAINSASPTSINTSGTQSGTHTFFFGGLQTWKQPQRGVIDGSSASTGYMGEAPTFASGNPALTSTTFANTNLCSLALTPGRWLVIGTGQWAYVPTSSTNSVSNSSFCDVEMSKVPGTVSGTNDATHSYMRVGCFASNTANGIALYNNVPLRPLVFNESANFTVCVNANAAATLTNAQQTVLGTITAIRIG